MPPFIQPTFDGAIGPIVDATDINGNAVKVILPGMAIIDPTTGDALGTAANPLVTSGGGGGGGSAVYGPDATGVAPTQPPVLMAGINPSGDVSPLKTDATGDLYARPLAAQYWPETSTPLAASATFNGASRDTGAASPGPVAPAYFNAMIYADQIGTATVERSNDNAAWTPAATAAIVADTPLTLQVPVTARYHRISVENGGTLQAVLSVNSSYTAS